MSKELQRAKKILQRINELAAVSEEEGCITPDLWNQSISGRKK